MLSSRARTDTRNKLPYRKKRRKAKNNRWPRTVDGIFFRVFEAMPNPISPRPAHDLLEPTREAESFALSVQTSTQAFVSSYPILVTVWPSKTSRFGSWLTSSLRMFVKRKAISGFSSLRLDHSPRGHLYPRYIHRSVCASLHHQEWMLHELSSSQHQHGEIRMLLEGHSVSLWGDCLAVMPLQVIALKCLLCPAAGPEAGH